MTGVPEEDPSASALRGREFTFARITPDDRARHASTPPFTVADVIRARAGDARVGMRFEGQSWTYAEMVELATERAALLCHLRRPGPFHVGVLLENVPEANLWLAAAALAGATVVPLNLTRRGNELQSDIVGTDCQVLVTEGRHLEHLVAASQAMAADRIIDVASTEYPALLAAASDTSVPETDHGPAATYLFGFTSGSTSGPKACIFSNRRLVVRARAMVTMLRLDADDVIYEMMPLFHNAGIAMCWLPGWMVGATHVMRPTFSASAFLPDVRRYGVTYFAYVGKVLSYILGTPEQPDDADNALLRGCGVEGSEPDIERFTARFGCVLRDAYGSTEGGVTIHRDETTPAGALGRPVSDTTMIVDPITMTECATAEFDEAGRLLNPDAAIGEIVDRADVVQFEGYYNNPEANDERVHDGLFWSGDLAYRDSDGWYYFAGRDSDMIRADGENLGTSQIEGIMARFDPALIAAAYATPAATGSDDLMVCFQLRDGHRFEVDDFVAFLNAQTDLSPKMVPRFVRITDAIPLTASQKVNRRVLRDERWTTSDRTWWRRDRSTEYVALTADDVFALTRDIAERGRDWTNLSKGKTNET